MGLSSNRRDMRRIQSLSMLRAKTTTAERGILMLTPKQAWTKECRWCSNCPPGRCLTTVCKLSPVFIFPSTLKRIKAHCQECAGEDGPKTCDGKLERPNANGNICFLHPFRLGKNPSRKKRTLSNPEYEKRCEVLKKARANRVKERKIPG